MKLPDWELKDLKAFYEMVAEAETKKLLKDTASGFAFPKPDAPLFRDTLTAIYVAGFLEGVLMMRAMLQENKLVDIAHCENPAELIELVKRFATETDSKEENRTTH